MKSCGLTPTGGSVCVLGSPELFLHKVKRGGWRIKTWPWAYVCVLVCGCGSWKALPLKYQET